MVTVIRPKKRNATTCATLAKFPPGAISWLLQREARDE
jgi:hypothetical protein